MPFVQYYKVKQTKQININYFTPSHHTTLRIYTIYIYICACATPRAKKRSAKDLNLKEDDRGSL